MRVKKSRDRPLSVITRAASHCHFCYPCFGRNALLLMNLIESDAEATTIVDFDLHGSRGVFRLERMVRPRGEKIIRLSSPLRPNHCWSQTPQLSRVTMTVKIGYMDVD